MSEQLKGPCKNTDKMMQEHYKQEHYKRLNLLKLPISIIKDKNIKSEKGRYTCKYIKK